MHSFDVQNATPIKPSLTINEEEEDVDDDDIEVPTESRISKALSEKTTKIVIILVLVMLFLLPLFQQSTYYSDPTSQDLGLSWVVI
jgi:hypothetical protein